MEAIDMAEYDLQRIREIQEKLSYAISGMEDARQRGCEDTMQACEYLAASYNKKLAQLVKKGNDPIER